MPAPSDGSASASGVGRGGGKAVKKVPHLVTPTLIAEALRLRGEGRTKRQISRAIGFHVSTVKRMLRMGPEYRRAVPLPLERQHRLTDATRERIVSLYGDGATQAEIVKAVGFSICTVAMVLRDARDEGDLRASLDPKIRRMAHEMRRTFVPAPAPKGEPPPPSDRLVLSLMARGMSRIAAQETAAAHRRARA